MTDEEIEKVGCMEYFRKRNEVLNSLGRTKLKCKDVKCGSCPLYYEQTGFNCDDFSEDAIKKRIEAIMEIEPDIEIDWLKVKKDTPIYVRNDDKSKWKKVHFAYYRYGYVYAYGAGKTSFTSDRKPNKWYHAKLAEQKGEENDD